MYRFVFPAVQPIRRIGWLASIHDPSISMLLSRFVVDLECKPRYEAKLSDQANLFDSRTGGGEAKGRGADE